MSTLSSRSCEYDIVRIILMLMLPIIHVVQYWGYMCDGADIIVHSDVDAITPIVKFALFFTAPCFMIMMGINMLFTRHNTPKDFLRRGLVLLFVEFVFNFVRYMLPALFGFAIGQYKPNVMEYAVFGMFNSDILAFAGLAFIVMAVLKKLKLSSVGVMLIALLMWLTGLLLTHFIAPWLNEHCSVQMLNILGSFVWVNTDSNFPLLNWIIFPAIGYFFMDSLRKTESATKKEMLWRYCGIVGLTVIVLEIVVTHYCGLPVYETLSVNGAHHYLTPWVVLFSTSATFVIMTLCHIVAPVLHRSVLIEKIVMGLGSKLTAFYLIQWTLVGWGLFITGGTNLWGCQQITFVPMLSAIIIITLISFIPAVVKIFH